MEPRDTPSHRTVVPAACTVVLAGGDDVGTSLAEDLPEDCYVIAADSGLVHAGPLGLVADVVIGDMDSVPLPLLERAEKAGSEIVRYPADKDATDLDLALSHAKSRSTRKVIVVGGHGGRIDHLLANALLLTSDRYSDLELSWWFGHSRIQVVRPGAPVSWHGAVGDVVSLLAVGSTATGVVTSGLRWALDGDDVLPGSTVGVSNLISSLPAGVSISSGILLAIHERTHP